MRTVICSPCGILGYGFPLASFEAALKEKPDFIVVDAGSTDAGPHKLGAGVGIVSRRATKKDLSVLLTASRDHHIPLIVGSCGGSGARKHTEWTLDIVREILEELSWNPKLAVIWADIDKQVVLDELNNGNVSKMSPNVPDITEQALRETNGVVAQMGMEPVLAALDGGAQVILCGRAYDPAPFAAAGIHRGHDPALSYHLGKILECGALCAEPGTAKDCMIGVLEEDSFDVYPTNPIRRCTPVSVAAHTFYEKDHPYLLRGPGILLDLSDCSFTDLGEGRVRVAGSRLTQEPYTVKLEGARRVAYRTFVIAGVRDPLMIEALPQVEDEVLRSVKEYYGDVPSDSHQVRFYHYGQNAVMGDLEMEKSVPREIGLMFEVVADSQELADAVCASLRSTLMHFGYPGRKSTAGNLAFPFAPSDVSFGPVYEFSIYHLMRVNDPLALFPIEFSGGQV